MKVKNQTDLLLFWQIPVNGTSCIFRYGISWGDAVPTMVSAPKDQPE